MTGLQEAFYIIAIVFMGVMFILIITQIYIAVVIRNRVVKIQRQIEDKINTVATIAEKTGKVAAFATGGVVGGARRALRKGKK
jgi:Na+-transporting methylmalonyl-CoA/oxaloacetate decarboxylase gamma subunit